MQTLVITYQGSNAAWYGPVKPIVGRYPLWTDVRISTQTVGELLARQRGKFGSFNIVDWCVHDDGKSLAQYEMECRIEERAERIRCTPIEWD